MKEITVEEFKRLLLYIFKDVAEFCDSNGIRYYMCGGTLLGAIRHKGFIPWDDDIDIMMPRPDYMKFIELYNGNNNRYVVKSIFNDRQYWLPIARVIDNRTLLRDDGFNVDSDDNGIFIDIFPVDGIPKSFVKRKFLFKTQEFLAFLFRASICSYTPSLRYKDSKDKLGNLKGKIRTAIKYISITLFRWVPTNFIVKYLNTNAMKYSFDENDYCGTIVDCHYGADKELMIKNIFEPRALYEFEEYEFYGTKGYDEYLKNLYGDYLELPPKDRRNRHHGFKVYWKVDGVGKD